MGNRYGVVSVSGEMIKNSIDVVAEIFSKIKVVVLRCEYKYAEDRFEYVMYSPLFEEVEVGVMAPSYKIMIETTYNNKGEIIDYTPTVSVEPYATGKIVPDSLVMPRPVNRMEVFK